MITLKRVKSWTELPATGMQIWEPNYAQKNDAEIMQGICSEWVPFGYNYGIMCEDTNTLHLYFMIQG
jgi:hypothetical protein